MKQEYTGNNCTRHMNPPYFLSNLDELNILACSMENILGLRYATHLNNFHRHHKGFDAVCKSTVNIPFLILQPKITIIQKIQQGTNNEGKLKEARQHQTKNGWLCSTNFQRINSKYISKLPKHLYRNKDNNSNYFTFSVLFAKYKREEVEIRHVPSYYEKNQLPSLTSTQLLLFDKVHVKQVCGPPSTSWGGECNVLFPRN